MRLDRMSYLLGLAALLCCFIFLSRGMPVHSIPFAMFAIVFVLYGRRLSHKRNALRALTRASGFQGQEKEDD